MDREKNKKEKKTEEEMGRRTRGLEILLRRRKTGKCEKVLLQRHLLAPKTAENKGLMTRGAE